MLTSVFIINHLKFIFFIKTNIKPNTNPNANRTYRTSPSENGTKPDIKDNTVAIIG